MCRSNAFPHETQGVDLFAKIHFPKLEKSQRNQVTSKTIPLRLLPLELAAEDSLRLLIVLALIDGVFENHETWDSLIQVKPGPHGTKIQCKVSAMDLPVSFLKSFSVKRSLHADSTDRYVVTAMRREEGNMRLN